MKTEQEQIEEMQEIIGDCYEFDSINVELGSGDGYINIEEAAQALIKAGYGDVAEYKAEIEQLKVKYKQLETNAEILARGVRDLNHENYELTEKIKQAQIDALSELKEKKLMGKNHTDIEALKASLSQSGPTYSYERLQADIRSLSSTPAIWDIDELIEEVQNAEDKS